MGKYSISEATTTLHSWLDLEGINEYQLGVLDRIGYALWRMIKSPPKDERIVKMYALGCLMASYQLGKGSPLPEAFFEAVTALDMDDFDSAEDVAEKIISLIEDTGW